MKKIFIFLLSTIFAQFSYSMDGDISIDLKCKYHSPRYSHVVLIDNRQSNQYLGYVQTGMFNKRKILFYKGNFHNDLINLFKNEEKQGDTLVLILDKIYLKEKTQFANELGFIEYKLSMYASTNDGSFRCILNKNETKELKAFDITKTLKKGFNDLFCEFSSYASQAPNYDNDTRYTYSEVLHLDSVEKLKIPMYNNFEIKKGLYENFSQFQINQPNIRDIIIDNSGNKTKVFYIDHHTKKKVRLDPNNIYAVSDGISLLKSTLYGFSKIKKEGNDFYYNDYLDENNPDMGAYTFGYILGGPIVASSLLYAKESALYKIKIDYKTGEAIPIKRSSEPELE